jgi:hypothetical protein
MIRGSETLTKLRDSIIDVEAQFKIMEEERLNSLEGKFILLSSAWERFVLTLGADVGLEGFFAGMVGGVTNWLNFLSDISAAPVGQNVRDELRAFESLLALSRDIDESLSVRVRAINELQLRYGELIGEIDLEKASNEEVQEVLERVRGVYASRLATTISGSALEKSLQEEEALVSKIVETQKELDRLRQATGLRRWWNENRKWIFIIFWYLHNYCWCWRCN